MRSLTSKKTRFAFYVTASLCLIGTGVVPAVVGAQALDVDGQLKQLLAVHNFTGKTQSST